MTRSRSSTSCSAAPGPTGVTHALATGLLGYTPDSLLDDVVDAFAAGDGAAVFGVVDRVIETGQDPRRFTEDLLRRLRDLVIVAAVPDAPATGLIDVSEDQGERLVAQAARFGKAELSRAADIVATGLTEMRGATAPRLLLELICARVLLPGRRPRDRRRAGPARPAREAGRDQRWRAQPRPGGGRRRRPLPPSTPSSRSRRRAAPPAPEPVAPAPPAAEEVAPATPEQSPPQPDGAPTRPRRLPERAGRRPRRRRAG